MINWNEDIIKVCNNNHVQVWRSKQSHICQLIWQTILQMDNVFLGSKGRVCFYVITILAR